MKESNPKLEQLPESQKSEFTVQDRVNTISETSDFGKQKQYPEMMQN
jgi:hypothetical protein